MMKVVRPWRRPVDRFLDACLGLDVERAGRLVEHEDRRVLQDRAGDRDALALAARKLAAALADGRIVARALGQDEVVRGGGLGGGMDLGRSRAPARPMRMFSSIERLNSPASWKTAGDRLAQRHACVTARGIDAVDQDPAVRGVCTRCRRLISVVLPAPVGPTMATV